MNGVIFEKLSSVEDLTCMERAKANEYKKTTDFRKICQIVNQYKEKYQKDMTQEKWIGFQTF